MKHVITLEIELVDLPPEERKELAAEAGIDADMVDDPDEGLPNAADVSIVDLIDAIEMTLEDNDEMWAGSGCYCKIVAVRGSSGVASA